VEISTVQSQVDLADTQVVSIRVQVAPISPMWWEQLDLGILLRVAVAQDRVMVEAFQVYFQAAVFLKQLRLPLLEGVEERRLGWQVQVAQGVARMELLLIIIQVAIQERM
jgi:hypothetical protein